MCEHEWKPQGAGEGMEYRGNRVRHYVTCALCGHEETVWEAESGGTGLTKGEMRDLLGGPTARNRRIERAAVALLNELASYPVGGFPLFPTDDVYWEVRDALVSELRKAVAS